MDNVIQPPELVANILYLTDMRTLLSSAQRVCRGWHEVIQLNRFQKALFLEPHFDSPVTAHNPVLMDTFPFLFDQLHLDPKEQLPLYAQTSAFLDEKWQTFPHIPHVFEKIDAFERPEASWRRMLPRQPPLRQLVGLLSTSTAQSRIEGIDVMNTINYPPTVLDLMHKVFSGVKNPQRNVIVAAFQVIWSQKPNGNHDKKMKDLLGQFVRSDGAMCHVTFSNSFTESQTHPDLVELQRIMGPARKKIDEVELRGDTLTRTENVSPSQV